MGWVGRVNCLTGQPSRSDSWGFFFVGQFRGESRTAESLDRRYQPSTETESQRPLPAWLVAYRGEKSYCAKVTDQVKMTTVCLTRRFSIVFLLWGTCYGLMEIGEILATWTSPPPT
ncbi:hypothetical protein PVAP13_4NG317350 [Panicum virgatum]|uniref:Uncharacterized protein n=1 Tax=Panicum virgatum TaxID=38727 RepID=A0A8T0TGW7_PANVG|nr:hypothetical protein PVAP13_4NG317350 [Panicum virgatum]